MLQHQRGPSTRAFARAQDDSSWTTSCLWLEYSKSENDYVATRSGCASVASICNAGSETRLPPLDFDEYMA